MGAGLETYLSIEGLT